MSINVPFVKPKLVGAGAFHVLIKGKSSSLWPAESTDYWHRKHSPTISPFNSILYTIQVRWPLNIVLSAQFSASKFFSCLINVTTTSAEVEWKDSVQKIKINWYWWFHCTVHNRRFYFTKISFTAILKLITFHYFWYFLHTSVEDSRSSTRY